MDVRFDEILANQDLFGQQLIDGDIGRVVSEILQGGDGSFRISPIHLDKYVDVQGGAGIPMDREGRRSNDDELHLMVF